jgi:hypothetical protein
MEARLGRQEHRALLARDVPRGDATDVTESFRTIEPSLLRPLELLGYLRKRRNLRDMRTTLEPINSVVEA